MSSKAKRNVKYEVCIRTSVWRFLGRQQGRSRLFFRAGGKKLFTGLKLEGRRKQGQKQWELSRLRRSVSTWDATMTRDVGCGKLRVPHVSG